MLPPEQDGWKLVRHKMPDGWRDPIIREVRGEEHARFLRWKIDEEVDEVLEAGAGAKLAEEIADVRQALMDLCNVTCIALADLAIEPYDELAARVPKGPKSAVVRALGVELRAHADALLAASDEELGPHIRGISETLGLMTAAAKAREDVRAALQRKLDERGGFNPGIAWKVVEKPLG